MLFTHDLEESAITSIRRGHINLYLIGLVDYVDKFGTRHRVGYARMFVPGLESASARQRMAGTEMESPVQDNLSFLPDPGYNYDRERKKGEGYDWE